MSLIRLTTLPPEVPTADVLTPASAGLVRMSISDTQLWFGSRSAGEAGTLCITESRLIWWSGESGLAIPYPTIGLQAVSRDTAAFAHPCIYCQLTEGVKAPAPFAGLNANGDPSDPSSDESSATVEMRFVPSDTGLLDNIYNAMVSCQGLHPSVLDEHDDENAEMFFQGSLPGDGPMDVEEGQFDDAEDE